jgi:hypothetical protein
MPDGKSSGDGKCAAANSNSMIFWTYSDKLKLTDDK